MDEWGWSTRRAPAGLYAVELGPEGVKIGMSKDLPRRINEHRSLLRRYAGRDLGEVRVFPRELAVARFGDRTRSLKLPEMERCMIAFCSDLPSEGGGEFVLAPWPVVFGQIQQASRQFLEVIAAAEEDLRATDAEFRRARASAEGNRAAARKLGEHLAVKHLRGKVRTPRAGSWWDLAPWVPEESTDFRNAIVRHGFNNWRSWSVAARSFRPEPCGPDCLLEIR